MDFREAAARASVWWMSPESGDKVIFYWDDLNKCVRHWPSHISQGGVTRARMDEMRYLRCDPPREVVPSEQLVREGL